MNPPVVSTVVSESADDPVRIRADKKRKWKIFMIGLSVRLLGVALLWFGDGSPSLVRKAAVVVGLILSIGGIGVLRYLLVSGFRRKK